MNPFLASDAWIELSGDYHLSMGKVPRPYRKTLPLSELLEGELCQSYLGWLMEHIGAPNTSVASSMLVKRIASLLVAPVLSAMTLYNKGIGAELEHCHLFHQDARAAGTAFPFMTLSEVEVTAPEASNRESWRAEIVQQLFRERLTPVMKAVAAAGPVSMAILWENVMARIAPVYADLEDKDEELRQRMRDDFHFIAISSAGELFGMRKNPFSSFTELGEGQHVTGRSRRLTCCLYYQMAPEYCLKCPKL
ncbi:IucA/IucC family C-terminal-domain containing protein [Paenibacillus protaetiae]|uniref:Ferric iron reductase n=1 Tax=Paenibacillus protaetiae TaxID=2509456 RepID=A0A4P6F5J3_9BACL|nr:IucA/IucC family C-terminal-domain containing protein [Paenibacillus protaetiae]QAY68477.1 ferric iron reductase [Paenibacillus protaetiae]